MSWVYGFLFSRFRIKFYHYEVLHSADRERRVCVCTFIYLELLSRRGMASNERKVGTWFIRPKVVTTGFSHTPPSIHPRDTCVTYVFCECYLYKKEVKKLLNASWWMAELKVAVARSLWSMGVSGSLPSWYRTCLYGGLRSWLAIPMVCGEPPLFEYRSTYLLSAWSRQPFGGGVSLGLLWRLLLLHFVSTLISQTSAAPLLCVVIFNNVLF